LTCIYNPMEILALNMASKDKRVGELAKIAKAKGIKVIDSHKEKNIEYRKTVLFVEPRAELPKDAEDYMQVFDYKTLSNDDKFIEENNYLTALAMKEIMGEPEKMLVIGAGKLTAQIENVFTSSEIHILNFNHHKVQELSAKYGDKVYFENAPYGEFSIIINTIPKQLVHAVEFNKDQTVYELASPPYGIAGDTSNLKYEILPGLPGKFYPEKAAVAVMNAMARHFEIKKSRPTIALCITGSSCCYLKLLPVLTDLAKEFNLIPVVSANANLPNRFCDIEKFRRDIYEICGNPLITTIAGAETLSANKSIVASLVLPATGNTVSKLANAVTDTCVTMAVKALLRNAKPCIIGISTNDALSGNASNIGMLLNRKNYYFIPFSQDDHANKPFSMVCDFAKAGDTIKTALKGKQLQPIIN